jgi:hypothetical protein
MKNYSATISICQEKGRWPATQKGSKMTERSENKKSQNSRERGRKALGFFLVSRLELKKGPSVAEKKRREGGVVKQTIVILACL